LLGGNLYEILKECVRKFKVQEILEN
jgi:hypothetical protein